MNHDEAMRRIANGGEVSGYDRNLWGQGSDLSRYWSANRGYMPKRTAKVLDELAEMHGGYEGVVYSYGTPIAVKIGGVWLAPDVSYSATTSGRHQSQLYILGAKWMPRDAGIEELGQILAGCIVYDRYPKKYRKGRA